ncbi:MAG: hypothetical protein IKZ28_02795 [Clostridia bacterium]|nr:hypothetical protein [Clostridia bacterium]
MTKKSYEYVVPHLAVASGECRYGDSLRVSKGVTDPEAVELWETVMREVKTKDGKTLLETPTTPSRLLADKIIEFMNDEDHIFYAFDGDKPKAKDIYKAARFGKSTWGRIMAGELSDLERGNVFALALALRLNEEQTADLLHSAGFCVNYGLDLDAAVMYFIRKEERDLDKIWRILGEFCNVKNGLDCFIFRPVTEKQQPERLK